MKTLVFKEWAEASGTTAGAYTGFFPSQTLNKVSTYNSTENAEYKSCWDFVAEGTHLLYTDIDSEIVGKSFLHMLAEDKCAVMLKEAYDALDNTKQTYSKPIIDEMTTDAQDLEFGADGTYVLAQVKLWVESYNEQTDDGLTYNTLTTDSATDQCELLVYFKLRSVEEPTDASLNNTRVAAYEDGYKGIGGYGYCYYLFLTSNSPPP